MDQPLSLNYLELEFEKSLLVFATSKNVHTFPEKLLFRWEPPLTKQIQMQPKDLLIKSSHEQITSSTALQLVNFVLEKNTWDCFEKMLNFRYFAADALQPSVKVLIHFQFAVCHQWTLVDIYNNSKQYNYSIFNCVSETQSSE